MANFNAIPYHDVPETINQNHSNPSPIAPRTTWEASANIDASHCVAVVYKGDRLVTAGLFWALSDDFSKDKGFVLQWCDEVKEEMKRPEDECLIGSDRATYYDVATDTRVEMRDAVAFIDKINKKVAEKRAKERVKG